MAYDPTEPTSRDVIRGLVRDTSNDPETEMMADATYDVILGAHGVVSDPLIARSTVAFYRAAGEVARRLATHLDQQPSSIASTGDGSVGWTSRTQSLRELAAQMDLKALEIEGASSPGIFGAPVTFRSYFLTGPDWGE